MMNSSFDESGVQFGWDATSIELAHACLRKYEYKMIEGWQSRNLNEHIRFGQHYATALEHFYKHRALGLTKDEATFLVVKEALIDTWEHDHEVVNPDGTKILVAGSGPWQSGVPDKNRENLIRTIIWYIEEFDNESIKVVIKQDGTPAVEHSFAIPVDNGVVFSGHIDRLVNFGGDIYVMDQKTTKQVISPYYFKSYSPNTQMSMYTFAGQIIYNAPVKGVIIDAAQIAVGFSRFERGFTWRTASQLEEWYEQSMYHIEAAQRATRDNYFPQNPSSCSNYGGCPFRDVCAASPGVRERLLEADFVKGPRWDPLKRR